MSVFTTGEVDIFYAYAHQDETLQIELQKHLVLLKRQRLVSEWHYRKIMPGAEWGKEIDVHLRRDKVILLLVSPDFLASDYCYDTEVRFALQRHEKKDAQVIPIILRPVDWKQSQFSKLQVLPKDGKPVTTWAGRSGLDRAFLDIALGIRSVIQAINQERVEKYEKEHPRGNDIFNDRETSGLTQRMNFALQQGFVLVHTDRANRLLDIKRYEEALVAYDLAIDIDPNYAFAYIGKGDALSSLKRYEEALLAYTKALQLDHYKSAAYSGKGNILFVLKQYEEALINDQMAILLDPSNAVAYYNMGLTLKHLGRLEEAREAFEKAQQLGYQMQ